MINFLWFLYQAVSYIIDAYTMLLVVYALMTWFPNARRSRLGYYIARLVEPYLNIFHRLIPPIGMISISVIVAIFFLRLVESGAHTVILFLMRLLA